MDVETLLRQPIALAAVALFLPLGVQLLRYGLQEVFLQLRRSGKRS